MNKQNNRLVPELRFPEFLSNSGWETVYGNKAFEQISNKDHNSDLPILAITQEYGAIPRETIDYNVSVTEKSVQSYKVVDVGDFIISLRSFQGGIEYSEYKGLCSPAYVILRNKKGIDKRFFKQYFKAKSFIRDLTKNLEGLRDGKMISYKQFSEVLLPKPSTEEQQKIADCLASIDELITLHTQKLEAFKDHKKGLMQQLFPSEGEVVPKLRFPEYRNKAVWKKIVLRNLVDIRSGFSPSKYVLDDSAEIAFLKVEDLNNCEKYQIKSRFYSNDREGIVPAGSVIFPKRGAAISLNKVRLNVSDVLIDTNLMAITPNDKIYAEFLYYLILSIGLFKIADMSTIPQINNKHINPYEVLVPSKEEQEKIFGLLSSVDSLISAQVERVDELKSHKSGLMQKLFPVMDGVVQ
ncbi:restriction endonuclease subunit S [Dickeya fangzhongdai]|uniref:restriction endonuclease subunit S n=1 Tax=Dickeya fangzhongdai TaxID=1778540 RepID=UPI003307AAB2